jgi:putative YphP/YqiW family bacilliredoxin
MYPEELVLPMRKQLTDQGFSELKTVDDVEKYDKK